MDEAILHKIDEINEALEDSYGMGIESSAQTMEESLLDMHKSMSEAVARTLESERLKEDEEEKDKEDQWFQSLEKYMSTLKQQLPRRPSFRRSRGSVENFSQLMYEKSLLIRNSIVSVGIRSRFETFSMQIEAFPDTIKARFGS